MASSLDPFISSLLFCPSSQPGMFAERSFVLLESDRSGTSHNLGDPAAGDPWHLLYLLRGTGRHLPALGQFGVCRYRF